MFGMDLPADAEFVKPRCKFEDLIYPEHIKAEIKILLEEEPFAHALIEEGLHPKRKILLHGPSGCGKTSIAHAIASEFGLDLFAAPANVLQDKYVGQSEKNVANVIKKASEKKCVLLMDEFDSIAVKRQDGARFSNSVVNTLLTSLENGAMEGFLVACTNHLAHLDDALLRRFDLILEIPMPTKKALIQVAEKVLRGRYGISIEDALKGGNTPALVELRAKELLRREVIKAEKINPRPKPKPVAITNVKIKHSSNLDYDGLEHAPIVTAFVDVDSGDAYPPRASTLRGFSLPSAIFGGGGGGGGGSLSGSKWDHVTNKKSKGKKKK